jgi:hypothetical protein
MDTKLPDKSQAGSSTLSDEEIGEAKDNLERALKAYDREGDAGLNREMQRIHPDDPSRIQTPIGTFVLQKGGSLQPDGKGRMRWVPDQPETSSPSSGTTPISK